MSAQSGTTGATAAANHDEDAQQTEGLNLPTGPYRHFCLFVVFLVLVLAYADRGILGVIIEGVKHEFGLSDLQLGLLSGPAFAVFYALMGIPLARWSDMGNRRIVIAVCLSIWSLMTALGGACQTFVQLFVTRIGVGIGEAGAAPPTHSLVSDYYPPHQHGKAASVLMFAAFVGGLIGISVGGYLLEAYSWRVAMYALGLPGLLVAVLVFVVLREPRRQTRFPQAREIFNAESRGIIRGLFAKKTYLHLVISMAIYSFFSNGVGAFAIPYFMRSFGVNGAEIGAKYGLVYAGSALVGTVIAAIFVDKLQRRNVGWLQLFPAIACALAFPCFVAAFMAGSFNIALIGVFFGLAAIGVAGPAIYATLYAVVRSDQRAMAVAVMGLCANLLGMGLGPVGLGALSDALTPVFGDEAMRYSLMTFSVFVFWASLHMFIASRTLGSDYVGQRPDLVDLDEAVMSSPP